jgi:phosphoribosylaminoimidazole (AIR) synthetase
MEPIKPPDTFKIYTLIRQTGAMMSYTAYSGTHNIGSGFFTTLQEAEYHRTLETLRETTVAGPKTVFHVFELDVPNPIYNK